MNVLSRCALRVDRASEVGFDSMDTSLVNVPIVELFEDNRALMLIIRAIPRLIVSLLQLHSQFNHF